MGGQGLNCLMVSSCVVGGQGLNCLIVVMWWVGRA